MDSTDRQAELDIIDAAIKAKTRKVPEDARAVLERHGLWASWLEYRTKLKEGGLTALPARVKALEVFKGLLAAKDTPGEAAVAPVIEEVTKQVRRNSVKRYADIDAIEGIPEHVAIGDEVRWVAAYCYVDGVTIDKAPSLSAWSLLQFAKANQKDFFQGPYTRLMPSQRELNVSTRMSDDGRQQLNLLSQLLVSEYTDPDDDRGDDTSLLSPDSEGVQGESPVSVEADRIRADWQGSTAGTLDSV